MRILHPSISVWVSYGEFTVMVTPFDPNHGPGDQVLVSRAPASQDEPMEPKLPVQENLIAFKSICGMSCSLYSGRG